MHNFFWKCLRIQNFTPNLMTHFLFINIDFIYTTIFIFSNFSPNLYSTQKSRYDHIDAMLGSRPLQQKWQSDMRLAKKHVAWMGDHEEKSNDKTFMPSNNSEIFKYAHYPPYSKHTSTSTCSQSSSSIQTCYTLPPPPNRLPPPPPVEPVYENVPQMKTDQLKTPQQTPFLTPCMDTRRRSVIVRPVRKHQATPYLPANDDSDSMQHDGDNEDSSDAFSTMVWESPYHRTISTEERRYPLIIIIHPFFNKFCRFL